jgi:hypothetical protein
MIVVSGLTGTSRLLAQQPVPDCERIPANIDVTGPLRSIVERALAQAPTVRRQCRAIAAAPHVRVSVRLRAGRLLGGARAEATITRFEYGALFAEIRLPVCVNPIEMLAHELEHVIEQMEGIDLARLSEQRDSGVSRLAYGAFETKRAEAAGRTAAHELTTGTTGTTGSTVRRVPGTR